MGQLDPKAKEFEAQIDSVENRLDRLRSLYEQYFQGIERIEPSMERNAVKRVFQNLRKIRIRNTALRFRFNQLVARMSSYENYWNRIVRQMEEGTYHRDVYKARYRAKAKVPTEEAPREEAPTHTEEKTQVPAPAAAAESARPAQRGRPTSRTLNDKQVGAIYDAYMLAKRRCKESTGNLTKDTLAKSLRKQVPAIIKQYRCKSVEFKVVIKKGKAILKAVPKF
jgi:hypothetical protein